MICCVNCVIRWKTAFNCIMYFTVPYTIFCCSYNPVHRKISISDLENGDIMIDFLQHVGTKRILFTTFCKILLLIIGNWLLEKIFRETRSMHIAACRYKLVKRALDRDIARSEFQHVTLCYIEFNSSSMLFRQSS